MTSVLEDVLVAKKCLKDLLVLHHAIKSKAQQVGYEGAERVSYRSASERGITLQVEHNSQRHALDANNHSISSEVQSLRRHVEQLQHALNEERKAHDQLRSQHEAAMLLLK